MQQGLPAPPGHFSAKKSRILSQLAVPDAEYADASPKGTVDVGIRGLIDLVNEVQGLVTTSSCAGRVSVFVEGSKKAPTPAPAKDQDPDQTLDSGTDIKAAKQQVAGVGGKGAGGAWLFVSHDPVQGDDWIGALQMEGPGEDIAASLAEQRLIHFKFEPMVGPFVFHTHIVGA